MAKGYAERCKEAGIKLELTWFAPRKCWKKFWSELPEKLKYLHYPNTKQGYEAALLEWAQIKATHSRNRPHADVWQHHKDTFQIVKTYWDQFGCGRTEARLKKEVDEFLEMIDEVLAQPELPEFIGIGWTTSKSQFYGEFTDGDFGRITYRLPAKWQERKQQLEDNPAISKQPQTIKYWLDLHATSQYNRSNLRIRSKSNKDYKIQPFKSWIDQNRHVLTLNEQVMREFHDHIYKAYPDSIDSQKTYYNSLKAFLAWLRRQPDCEFKTLPLNFDDPELRFVRTVGAGTTRLAKRQHLWTPEEFKVVLEQVPQPYRTYCVLMLNCGFRQSDLNALTHSDLRLSSGRLLYQRNKTINIDTSPVVNYPLWQITVDLIEEIMSDHPAWLFTTRTGNRLIVEEMKDGKPYSYDTVSRYWRRARDRFGLAEKRLDYIRKTGATIVQQYQPDVETLYLAESLKGVAKINYSFNDGEPNAALDKAIAHLGAEFGFCDPPTKTIELTPEMLEKLAAAGIEV